MCTHFLPPPSPPDECDRLLTRFWETFLWSNAVQLPDPNYVRQWTSILNVWRDRDDLPLLVRRSHNNRGVELRLTSSNTGRAIVPVDNAPAHWSIACAFFGQLFSIEDIEKLCMDRAVPVSDPRGLSSSATWRRTSIFTSFSQNADERKKMSAIWSSWSVRHIEDVAPQSKGRIEGLPIDDVKGSFFRLLDLSNMILVPKKWGPVAETPQFRDLARKRVQEHLGIG